VGDVFIVGAVYGKVRAMFDDRGGAIKQAGPSTPVEVLGLQGVPEAGDQFQVADEAKARHIVEYRQGKAARSFTGEIFKRPLDARPVARTIEDRRSEGAAGSREGGRARLGGSAERNAAEAFERPGETKSDSGERGRGERKRRVAGFHVGRVIVAFNVKPERKAAELAQREGVDIRSYTIIYELLDELQKAVAGLLAPVIKEQHLGRAEVRDTFRVKGVGTIAGCSVTEGIIRRDAEVRVIREAAVVLHRPNQFAEALQGRRQGSAPRLRVRHRDRELRGCEGGRQSGVLHGRKDRGASPASSTAPARAPAGERVVRLVRRNAVAPAHKIS
jgi:translation initiation factor IF-2